MCPDTFEVKCITNWQHIVIIPLLLATGRPRTFENANPAILEELKPPEYPEGTMIWIPKQKHKQMDL